MNWGNALLLGLACGVAHSLLFTVVLFAGLAIARDFMVHAYPPAIRDRYGPKGARGRRVTVAVSIIVYAGLAALLATTFGILRASSGTAGVCRGDSRFWRRGRINRRGRRSARLRFWQHRGHLPVVISVSEFPGWWAFYPR